MSHPLGNTQATLNQAAKDMTTAQVELAREICIEKKINSAEGMAAVIVALALNLRTVKE